MFTQDPFQTLTGAYAGAATPYGTLQNPFQNPFQNPLQNQGLNNPMTGLNPLAAILAMQQGGQQGYPGIQNYGGIHPHQLQHGMGFQNPLIAASLQNPLLAAVLQNQIQNQIMAALQQQQLQQQQNPFANPFAAQQYGYQPTQQQFGGQQGGYGQAGLAPQSWVGQGGQLGGAQALGQIHPLVAQLAARSIYGPSVPWGTY